METNIVPEKNRRKPEISLRAHIAETLIGKQSRKVAFGVWGFVAANALITAGKIDIPTYLHMFYICAALIGFGTILDETIAKFGDLIAVFAADKVKAVFTRKTEETTVTTTETPPAS